MSDVCRTVFESGYFYLMVAKNMLRRPEGRQAFLKINLKIDTVVDVNNCLTQIKLPVSSFALLSMISKFLFIRNFVQCAS